MMTKTNFDYMLRDLCREASAGEFESVKAIGEELSDEQLVRAVCELNFTRVDGAGDARAALVKIQDARRPRFV